MAYESVPIAPYKIGLREVIVRYLQTLQPRRLRL
jgi:hypothetical protein